MEKKSESGLSHDNEKRFKQDNTALLIQMEKQQLIEIKAEETVAVQAFQLKRNHLVENSKHLQETMEIFRKMSDETLKSEESASMEMNLIEKQMENTEVIVNCLKQNVDYLETVHQMKCEQHQINADKCEQLEIKIEKYNTKISDLKRKLPKEFIIDSLDLNREYENLQKLLQCNEEYLENLHSKSTQQKEDHQKQIESIKKKINDENVCLVALTEEKEKLEKVLNDLPESLKKLQVYFMELENEVQELKNKNDELEMGIQAKKEQIKRRITLENRLQHLQLKLQESTKLTNDLLESKLKLHEDIFAQKITLTEIDKDTKMKEQTLKEFETKKNEIEKELNEITVQKDTIETDHKILIEEKKSELDVYTKSQEMKLNELQEDAENIHKEITQALASVEDLTNDNETIEAELNILKKAVENLDVWIHEKNKTYERLSKKAENLEARGNLNTNTADGCKGLKKNTNTAGDEKKDNEKKMGSIMKCPKKPVEISKKVTFDRITYMKLPSDSSDGTSFLDDLLKPLQ